MKLALSTKNKMGFINGSVLRSKTDEVLASQWDRCNSVVLSWILGSVTEDLYCGQILSTNATEVWNELKETYDKIDTSIIFNLHQQIKTLKQNYRTLFEYYHKLNTLWKQYDAMVSSPYCTCGAVACSYEAGTSHKEHKKMMKLMQFLMGLSEEYTTVRSNILLRDSVLDVKEAYAIISREESHKGISSDKISKTQASAFVTQDNNTYNKNEESTSSAPASLTNEQLMKLLSLINDSDVPVETNSNMVGKFVNNNVFFNSNFKKFFSSHINDKFKNKNQGWIIDSGANQHMTSSNIGLNNVVDISQLNLTVGHPNGTQAKVIKVGNLKLSNNVILFDVLVVPEYCVSLLSVHKLSKDSQLTVSFDENKCFIQDLKAKTTLGAGSQSGGLYLFDEHNLNVLGMTCNVCVHLVSAQLWHARLGHPSDQVLKVLKNKLDLKDFKENYPCDICHKAKQTREPFPLSDHKSQGIGDLVHLDL
ncbi:uncharacterized protein [Rutidosis leptorrhynchoides]|uniref:uncharacterized protein n=1 Tax=Rutidosis leptorrhynchoides TaxID=125765 RepID=UPI003A993F91